MSDYITPEEARELLEPNGEYRNSIDKMFRRDAVFTLAEIAERAAEMLAWARVEYAVAKREDGKLEFWSGECWEGDSYDAYWHTDPDDAKPEYEGEFLVSRLVIDLEEEE